MTMLNALISFVTPGAEFVMIGNPETEAEYNSAVTWHDDRPQPSWADLEAARPQFDIDQANAAARINRASAYTHEADPLFFKWQRGEGTEQDWLDKVTEIRERFPYA